MGFIFEIFKTIFLLIYGIFIFIKVTFEMLFFGIILFNVSFVYLEKVIGFLLPFSTKMKDRKRKSTIIYLLFLIILKLAIMVFAWYLVVVPFVDAYLHGYFSVFFQFVLIPICSVLALGFLINFIRYIGMKTDWKERIISTMSMFFNYWTSMFYKIIYLLFLVTTLFMLFSASKGTLDEEVMTVIAKYDRLNVYILLIIPIIYAFTNRYVAVKVHQYFYYYFNLNVNRDEFEARLQQLSEHYTILYTKLDKYVYPDIDKQIYPNLYEVLKGFNLAENSPEVEYTAREIVLKNKYLPISFTLLYYTTSSENCYHAVYQREAATNPRRKRSKDMTDSDRFSRQTIIQENYSKKIKKQLEEGLRKVKFPLGKLLIVARAISIILIIIFVFLTHRISTWEAFLAMKSSVFWTILAIMMLCLFTYLVGWFYVNILMTIAMFFAMRAIGFTESPILFYLLIVLTIIVNLIVLSFWKQDKIEKLFNVRFTGPADKVN